MTAIAAVIALSTPSFAQSTGEPIAVTSAPAIEVTPAQAAADPLAPAAVAADPLAPEAAAKPAAGKATTAKSTAARPVAASAASTAPISSAAGATISDPDAAAPVEPQSIQSEAKAVPSPIAEPPAPANTSSIDPMIAGIGALGLLALVGTGLVARRRRRRAEDVEAAARRQFVDAMPDADVVPAMVAEPEPATPAMAAETAAVAAAVIAAHEPSPEIDGPVTELPEDFDVSRFGLHAQAAYNGPTEDNPSLSLKHRLSRASGMDQLAEREAEAEVAAAIDEVAAAKPAVSRSDNGDFMLGRGDGKPSQKPSVCLAHSH